MTLRLLTAGASPDESGLVARLERSDGALCVARRCVDLAELLATAATAGADAALVSADLRRLDRDALHRLSACGLAVVGLHRATDGAAAATLRSLGVQRLANYECEPAELAEAVLAAVDDLREQRAGPAGGRALDPSDQLPPATDQADPSSTPAQGRLVAVWGPTGAPGRTTIAVNLAAELALLGTRTLLADADVWGAAVAPVLGLLDEAPGLAAAARLANAGRLDLPALARLAPVVSTDLRVLTGIARPDRWPELRAASLGVVWSLARMLAATTVVDCGFSVETDDRSAFDSAGPRRNAATLTTLEQADLVIAVGAADPIGVARLVRALQALAEAVPGAPVRVVLNLVRRGPVGPDPQGQLAEALARHADVDVVAYIPYDRPACDEALRSGRPLADVAPASPARTAILGLAEAVAGRTARRRRRGLRRGA